MLDGNGLLLPRKPLSQVDSDTHRETPEVVPANPFCSILHLAGMQDCKSGEGDLLAQAITWDISSDQEGLPLGLIVNWVGPFE